MLSGGKSMKKNAVLLLLLILFSGCDKRKKELYENISNMDDGNLENFSDADLKEREAELKSSINEFKDILEEKVEAAINLGVYHKMLGKLYLDNKIYIPAMEEFKEALVYESENAILYYYMALAHARNSLAVMDEVGEYEEILNAEKYYLRAIELNEDFSRALYGLSILYVFKLDQPDKAVDYLEKFLETQKSDYDAMFLLANAYIRIGLSDRAADIYSTIIKESNNSGYKNQAQENRNMLMGGNYEQY